MCWVRRSAAPQERSARPARTMTTLMFQVSTRAEEVPRPDHLRHRCSRRSSASPRSVSRRRRRSGSPIRFPTRSDDRRSTREPRSCPSSRQTWPMPPRRPNHCCRLRWWPRGRHLRRRPRQWPRRPTPQRAGRLARLAGSPCARRSECCAWSYSTSSMSNPTNLRFRPNCPSRPIQLPVHPELPPPEHARVARTASRTPVPHRTVRAGRTSCGCGRRSRIPRCGDSHACGEGSSVRRPSPRVSVPIANSRAGRPWRR